MRRAIVFGVLFVIGIAIYSQILPDDRMAKYNDFQEFSTEFQYWYYARWINIEWGSMGRMARLKYRNNATEFGNEMMDRVHSAVERSRTDFRNKVFGDVNFKNDVKTLLEQLDSEKNTSTITNWNILLSKSGYSVDKYGYNNIERMGYNFLFFANACMLLDQEFPGNSITDSVIEKWNANLKNIRENNS